jgi:hypothetical protein
MNQDEKNWELPVLGNGEINVSYIILTRVPRGNGINLLTFLTLYCRIGLTLVSSLVIAQMQKNETSTCLAELELC